MGKGGWEHLDKACPNRRCAGLLVMKALGSDHLAVKCLNGDFLKNGRVAEITAWLRGRP